MFWVHIITLILAGALAASPIILGKRPDAKTLMDKLAPFQGVIGIVAIVLGIISAIDLIPNIGVLFKARFIYALAALLAMLCELGLGFILGYGLIDRYVLKGGGAGVLKAIEPFKVLGGLVAIGVAIFWAVTYFVA